MNALVSYGSSSEDEDEPKDSTVEVNENKIHEIATGDGQALQNVTQFDEIRSNQNGVSQQGPMIGPTRPENVEGDVEELVDDPDLEFYQLSERERLRYLTQPTYPTRAIPPSPPGSPDPAMNAKFKKFLELKAKGVHFNEDLAGKVSFQNPNLLPLLMEKAGVVGGAQYQTSLPQDVFDPSIFPASAFKEELLKSQQKIREQLEAQRREKSAAGKRTIEFTAGSRSGTVSRDSTPGSQAKRKKP